MTTPVCPACEQEKCEDPKQCDLWNEWLEEKEREEDYLRALDARDDERYELFKERNS